MESECNCPGCGETFSDPRVLPCKHVYCVTCVGKLSKTPADLGDPSKGTKSCCFLCETAFALANGDPESLPQSEQHLGFVKTYKEATTFASFKCEEHTDKEAVKRCLSGCGHVCQDCVSAHSTARALKGHQLIDVDTAKPVVFDTACPAHTQPFSKFCEKATDNPFLCDTCIGKHFEAYGLYQHENYETGVQKLCLHLEENKKSIGTAIASINSRQKSVEEKLAEISNYVLGLKDSAKKEFEKARQIIDDEEKRFLLKIDEYYEFVHKPYSAFGDYLKSLKMHLDYSSKLIEDSTHVFEEGKSPVKLPLAKDISGKILQKIIPQVPEKYNAFTETISKIDLFLKEDIVTEINDLIKQIGTTTNAINTKRTEECPEYKTFGVQLKQLETLVQNLKTMRLDKATASSIFEKLFEIIKREFRWDVDEKKGLVPVGLLGYHKYKGLGLGLGKFFKFRLPKSPSDLDGITSGDELAYQLVKIARELKLTAGI